MAQTSINHQTPPDAKRMLYAVPSVGVDVFVNDMACISKEWKQYRFPKRKRKKKKKKTINLYQIRL